MRVLIVDDEPLARSHLVRLCGLHADVDVVGEAESGATAIDLIRVRRPDVVLLDVELKDMNGFDVMVHTDRSNRPLAIMVTARPQDAIKALEFQVTDYLTKPVNAERFAAAIHRARQEQPDAIADGLPIGPIGQRRESADTSKAQTLSLRLIGERLRRLYFVEAGSVDYIESDANYVIFHTGDDSYLARNSIKHLSSVLAPLGFWRIERSLMVNMCRVEFAERLGSGKLAFTLRSGRRLVSSLSYRSSILREIRKGRLLGLESAD